MKKARGFAKPNENYKEDKITIDFGELFPNGEDFKKILKQHNKKMLEFKFDFFALSYAKINHHNIPVFTLINITNGQIRNGLMIMDESQKTTAKQEKECMKLLNQHYVEKIKTELKNGDNKNLS
ncbi:MAG: hypothetical protein QNJ74_13055 [Trichodesmium sp. MO_231.B1]|nr:hypothetical protein [Trichodesmium sp. MO_231.B1]